MRMLRAVDDLDSEETEGEAMNVSDIYAKMMREFLKARDDSESPIYAENVRAFFDIGYAQSALVLDAGLKLGLIDQRTAWMCPNDERVLFESFTGDPSFLPDAINCEACEAFEIEPHSFSFDDCRRIQLFRVKL